MFPGSGSTAATVRSKREAAISADCDVGVCIGTRRYARVGQAERKITAETTTALDTASRVYIPRGGPLVDKRADLVRRYAASNRVLPVLRPADEVVSRRAVGLDYLVVLAKRLRTAVTRCHR
jgi:hypothetical protein